MRGVLSLNSGSSSIKFALYTSDDRAKVPTLLCQGEFSGLPHTLHFEAQYHDHLEEEDVNVKPNYNNAIQYLLNWIKRIFPEFQLTAAGHRIVHGGARYKDSVIIDEEVLSYLDSLIPLAPLHQPHNLEGIRTLQTLHPSLPQVACFDTSFHHTQPPLATLFAIPYHFWGEGIRRYGFHGLSYRYISEVLPSIVGTGPKEKVVVAHLGHGASMCALKDLTSVATTMGLTALDGLPMGTRCGTIDPGVLLYLLSAKGYSCDELTDLLYNQSGLLGLSGISDDMKELQESENPRVKEAIEYFCYHIQRELGSLIAVLGGLDVLVFTGGIGENSALVRQKVCSGLKWLGIEIDENLNMTASNHKSIELSKPKQQPSVWVIPTNEEFVIVKDVLALTSL